jgi:hypothetical protein
MRGKKKEKVASWKLRLLFIKLIIFKEQSEQEKSWQIDRSLN